MKRFLFATSILLCTAPSVVFGEVDDLKAGGGHTCVLHSDSAVRCWGSNQFGQLGRGDTNHRGDEPSEMGTYLPAIDIGSRFPIAVESGGDFTCILTRAGETFCFGANQQGQLGIGSSADIGDEAGEMGAEIAPAMLGSRRLMSLAVGDRHVCGVTSDGDLLCWGSNRYGQLGLGDAADRGTDPALMGDNLAEVDLAAAGEIAQVVAGGMHSCVLNQTGEVYCWGDNRFGQLGVANGGSIVGDEPAEMGAALQKADLPSGNIVQLSAGFAQTCGRYSDGQVYCWGYNEDGRLGVGDQINRGLESAAMGESLTRVELGRGLYAEDLSCGYRSCCVRLINRAMKCWGRNLYGELGTKDMRTRGGIVSEMGDVLPYVELGQLEMVIDTAVGEFHTCALLDGDRIKCWGLNHTGQLGQGDVSNRGGSPNTMGTSLQEVEL